MGLRQLVAAGGSWSSGAPAGLRGPYRAGRRHGAALCVGSFPLPAFYILSRGKWRRDLQAASASCIQQTWRPAVGHHKQAGKGSCTAERKWRALGCNTRRGIGSGLGVEGDWKAVDSWAKTLRKKEQLGHGAAMLLLACMCPDWFPADTPAAMGRVGGGHSMRGLGRSVVCVREGSGSSLKGGEESEGRLVWNGQGQKEGAARLGWKTRLEAPAQNTQSIRHCQGAGKAQGGRWSGSVRAAGDASGAQGLAGGASAARCSLRGNDEIQEHYPALRNCTAAANADMRGGDLFHGRDALKPASCSLHFAGEAVHNSKAPALNASSIAGYSRRMFGPPKFSP